jgi:hypothetical protein
MDETTTATATTTTIEPVPAAPAPPASPFVDPPQVQPTDGTLAAESDANIENVRLQRASLRQQWRGFDARTQNGVCLAASVDPASTVAAVQQTAPTFKAVLVVEFLQMACR